MTILCRCSQRRQSGLKSEGRGSGSKKFRFSRQISEKFRFFQAISQKYRFFQINFRKISISQNNFVSSRQISEKCLFSLNFTKHFDFQEKIGHYTATSGQIILLVFKSHHFRTSCIQSLCDESITFFTYSYCMGG